jgi:hypothetical protein
MRVVQCLAAIVFAASTASCGAGDRVSSEASGVVRFHDSVVGVSGEYPSGWHQARALTNMVVPREVLALASFPLRGGDKAGECAPKSALADLPPDGAFIWLVEYRPTRGDVWADLPKSRFPPKAAHFELSRTDLQTGLCQPGPGYRATFRASDRPFDLLLAFGTRATSKRLRQVETILNSLRFDTVPRPPADPYAGWPLVNDSSGDSLRPPPGWPGAAVDYHAGTTPRPRLLFFASNRPLWGLPKRLVPHVDELPGADLVPTGALANDFPADGVVLFVLEEAKGGPSGEFPAIGRRWPSHDDFKAGQIATQAAPELMWTRAGGSFSGFRFSVWIGRAPHATDHDLGLAVKSAASLALSGCWRERYDDCPDL